MTNQAAKNSFANVWNFFCDSTDVSSNLCLKGLFYVVGKNKREVEIDLRIFKNFTLHLAREIAYKQVHHYWQLILSGKFCQFDYEADNRKFYNATAAPSYNLGNFKAPTYIYVGSCDG